MLSLIFNWISNMIFGMKDALSMAGSVAITIGCLFLIVLLAYFAIKIPSTIIAVIVSTIGTVFFMIPTVTSFNAIVDKQATSDLAKQYKTELELKKKETELLESKKELEKQKLISLRQKVNIETLKNEVTLLKNS